MRRDRAYHFRLARPEDAEDLTGIYTRVFGPMAFQGAWARSLSGTGCI